MRKWLVNWSAIGSPRPEPGTESLRGSEHLTSVPLIVDELLLMRRIHVPNDATPLNAVVNGNCGLNGPAPMPTPGVVTASWIGDVAASSKVVLVKLACGVLPEVPTPENSRTELPFGS